LLLDTHSHRSFGEYARRPFTIERVFDERALIIIDFAAALQQQQQQQQQP